MPRPRPRGAIAGLTAGALALACAQQAAAPDPEGREELPAAARAPSSLLLLSVSGLTADRYRGAERGVPAMPTLASLAAAGVSADAVRSVAPAAHFPAHASLVTGRRPAGHGIVADHPLGAQGVGRARYSHADALRAPSLWYLADDAGLSVATLGWPTTQGADIAVNVPDLEPGPDQSWLAALRAATDARSFELVVQAGGNRQEAQHPGRARDAVLAGVACQLLSGGQPPSLLLLHLSQTAVALATHGIDAPETRRAFAGADGEVRRLLDCARQSGRLDVTSIVVVGGHGAMPVHTLVAPNLVLGEAGLLTPGRRSGAGVISWTAIARSNGGSAFVYAAGSEDAMLARRVLGAAARNTGAFRVVSAEEMLGAGADPDAWFGLEAEAGYVFSDISRPPLMRPALARGSWGYLPGRREMDAGFVAWGAGFRKRVRVPRMRQTDVAPTLAPLLGLSLDGADGRALVGVLGLSGVAAGGE